MKFYVNIAAAAALALMPATSRASILFFQFTGVASGVDTFGMFGAAGASLDGEAFTLRTEADEDLFIVHSSPTEWMASDETSHTSLTIGGKSVTFYSVGLWKANDAPEGDIFEMDASWYKYSTADDYFYTLSINIQVISDAMFNTADPHAYFDYDLQPDDSVIAALDGTGSTRPTFDLHPMEVSGGTVPEPATWISAIFGFGAVGGVMRRRHQASLTFG